MRLILMGTGPFAVPTFEALYATPHEIALLVTRPPRGRNKGPAGPTSAVAAAHNTPVIQPASINTDSARDELAKHEPDLMIVCDYGQILQPETLAIATHGGINLHASLLPKYRGAAPIHWALYHGDTETGVTVIHMSPRVDAGPCVAMQRTEITADENAVTLENRLAMLSAPLVCDVVSQIASGTIRAIDQDPRLATKAPRLKKTDGQVDWNRTAQQISNQVRALQPWPRTFTFLHRKNGKPLRLILDRVAVVANASDAEPGQITSDDPKQLIVATGEGALLIETLQPSGKRSLSAAEFLRGNSIGPGDAMGPEESTA